MVAVAWRVEKAGLLHCLCLFSQHSAPPPRPWNDMCGPLSPAAACRLAHSPGSPHSVALGEHRASGSLWTSRLSQQGPHGIWLMDRTGRRAGSAFSSVNTILLPGAWQAVGRLNQKVTVGYVLHIIPVPLVPQLLSQCPCGAGAPCGQERVCWEADWDRGHRPSHKPFGRKEYRARRN